MSSNNYILVTALALLVACSHDFNNPLDPQNQEENKAPVADFTMEFPLWVVGQDVTFDADSTFDPDNGKDELQLRWDFNRDQNNIWERRWDIWSVNRTVSFIYPDPGIYWVVLEVQDPKGNVDRAEKQVEIKEPGPLPFAKFIISPPIGNPDTEFTLNASNSKNAVGDTMGLLYRWRFDNGQPWLGWQDKAIISVNYANAPVVMGLKTITLQVRENSTGMMAEAMVQMEVTDAAQSHPTALFTVMPARGNTTTQFNVDASSSVDREDDISQLQVQWDFGNGQGWSGWSFNKTHSVIYASPGPKTITLQVRDSHQVISVAMLQVYID